MARRVNVLFACLVSIGGAGCSSDPETESLPGAPAPEGGGGEPGPRNENGCVAKPSCSDRANDGSFCAPICAPECQTKHVSSAMWVSPYEVSGSYGLGRHQGGAILSVSFTFDERAPGAGTKLALSSLPPDMEAAMLGGNDIEHDHASFAPCESPSIVFDRSLANHGRGLSRAAQHAASRMNFTHYADVRPGVAEDIADEKALSQCLGQITNGYCDSVCGNCSYVLPYAAIMDSRDGDWSYPESLVYGGGVCKEGYYGGPNQVSTETWTGAHLPNPYVHCAYLGCAESHNDEAPSLKTTISTESSETPMTGVFGHNSNTDAEAEYRAFHSCVAGKNPMIDACAACGTGTEGRQDPCGARTNTAAAIWDKTATASLEGAIVDDKVPVVVDPNAGTPEGPPICSWGKFPVRGM